MSPYPRRYGGKGDGPRLEHIVTSLNAARGTAYDVSSTSTVYAENMACARVLNAAWGTNARLANAFDPQRATGSMLPRWEKILGLFPAPTDDEVTRRAALVAKWKRFGQRFNTSRVMTLASALLGSALVEVEFADAAGATSFWQGGSQSSRTNLLAASEWFAMPAWTTFGCSIATHLGGTVPSGPTVPADRIIEDGSTGLHGVGQAAATPTGGWGTMTLSVYASAGTRTQIALTPRFGSGSTDGVDALFDLSSGTVVSTSTTGAGVLDGTNVTALGGGWYRVSVTFHGLTDGFSCAPFILAAVGGAYSYAGTAGVVAVEAVGAVLEKATAARAYDAPWYSTIAHILFKVQQPAGMSDGEFYDTVNAVNAWLDGEAPADCTWDWWRVDSVQGVQGFYLDSPHNLSNDAFDV